jgi:hypothetical protein
MQLASGSTAAMAGLLAGEAVLLFSYGRLPIPIPFPMDALLFGAAGAIGGLVFWRNVRNETNPPDDTVSPPVPSSTVR